MRKWLWFGFLLLLGCCLFGEVFLVHGDRWFVLEDSQLAVLPTLSFSVAFHGVTNTSDENLETENWRGIPLSVLLGFLGTIPPDATITLIAQDGFSREFPLGVLRGAGSFGTPVLALEREGEPGQWLTFFAQDGQVTNEDMLQELGEAFSSFHGGQPSARGLLVKDVRYLVVNWDGDLEALHEQSTHSAQMIEQQGEEKEEWSLSLSGAVDARIDPSVLQEWKERGVHLEERVFARKSTERRYDVLPLWMLVAMVDDLHDEHPFSFAQQLWEDGYLLTLTAQDGYAVSFSTTEMSTQALFVAFSEEGEPTWPKVVGEVSGKFWVSHLQEIDAQVPRAQEDAPSFTLAFSGPSGSFSRTLEQLRESEFFVEGPGSYTTSAGTRYTNHYAGVDMGALLVQQMGMTASDTVEIIALDGYEMSYSAEEILDQSSGTWILAFERDGMPLPQDPGPVRTVRIGEATPNVDGHNSLKMVKRVQVIPVAYRPFQLQLSGLMQTTLDRDQLQSGISCHRQRVVYQSKENSDTYTGIAVWRLLAFVDDPAYAPHRQDEAILSYNQELAAKGYSVIFHAVDGYQITLSSLELDRNDAVLVANAKNGSDLESGEWPLVLVFDSSAERLPEGIKKVKQLAHIEIVLP
ncbi:MAG TPA: hypothetical protein PLF96_02655 [Thermotogota bacterium]|nr:hypothetical protein [Thermotogota bacterium]